MATESNEQENQVKSRNYEEHRRSHLGKKIEPDVISVKWETPDW